MLSTRNGMRRRQDEHRKRTYLDICYSWNLFSNYWPKQRSISVSSEPCLLLQGISTVIDMTGTYSDMMGNLFSTRNNCGSVLWLSNEVGEMSGLIILCCVAIQMKWFVTEGMGQKGISWDAIKAIQCICVDTDSKMPGTQSHLFTL